MFQRLNNRLGHHILLLIVGSGLFLVNLGGPSLWDVDEGRNSTATLEMWSSGDWIKPTFNGQLRDHKPVLLYWLQAAAYQIFGVNEFAARLPSALAALLTVLLTYELGRSLFGPGTGLLGGLIAASTIMLGAAAHFANPDALLNLFTVLSFGLFWWGFSRTGKPPFFMLGVASGLAMLAKGPVGLILPTAAVMLYLLWVRKLRILLTSRMLLGVLSFSLVALPWYILVGVETKVEFLSGFLMKHNVQRFLGSMERHDGGVWYYPTVLMIGFAPWSAFLGATLWYSLWSAFRSPWGRARSWWTTARDTGADLHLENDSLFRAQGTTQNVSPSLTSHQAPPITDRYRLLWCWIAVYLVFFTIAATKLPNYILPLAVPLALLTARLLDRWRTRTLGAPGWLVGLGLVCFGLFGVGAGMGLLFGGGVLAFPGLQLPVFTGLEILAWVGLIPLAGVLLAWWNGWRQRRSAALTCLTVAAVLSLAPLFAWTGQFVEQFKPARSLVLEAHTLQPTQEICILNYKVENLASLHFYCQRGVDYCASDEEVMTRLRSPQRIYVFLPTADWNRLRTKVGVPCRVLAHHADLNPAIGEVTVVTNERSD